MDGGQEDAPRGWQADTGRDRALANAAGDQNIAHKNPDFKTGNVNVAIDLARSGLPVFPCAADKRPKVRWKEAATNDATAIGHLWQQHYAALVGLPTGARSGLFVIDLDVERETGEEIGTANFNSLGFGDLLCDPTQIRVRTPSGGLHLYFRHPGEGFGNTAGKLGPKIDTRGEGGYVIAPGSILPDGRFYEPEREIEWRNLPDLPDDLRSALSDGALPIEQSIAPDNLGSRGWGAAVLARECQRVAAAPVGGRNSALNQAAFYLGKASATGALDAKEVEGRLRDAAQAAGLDHREIGPTIASGLGAGIRTVQSGAFTSWPDPDPRFLSTELPSAPTLPVADIFGLQLTRWCHDAAEDKSAPLDYVFTSLIAVAGATIGNARWVSPWRGWAEPPIIWAMCIGLPSAGKSPAIDAVLTPLRKVEKPLRAAAAEAVIEWKKKANIASIHLKQWETAVKKAIESGQPTPAQPREADAGPAPHVPRLFVNDSTIERLGVILAAQPRGTLQIRDELAGWLEGMARYAGGGTDRPFWLESYGGRPYVVERQSREPLTIDRLTIGVLGGIQPDRLKSLLFKSDDDGLLARFLPIWPEPVPPRRPKTWANQMLIEATLDQLHGLGLGGDPDVGFEPVIVAFSDDACASMDQFRQVVRNWETGAEGLLLSFIGKLPGLAARLSLILAFLDWAAEGSAEPTAISADHFGRATRLVDAYLLPMARRCYADASAPQDERVARRLLGIVREHRWQSFSSREVLRLDRAGLRTADEINPALARLQEADCIRSIEYQTGARGGRPPRLYEVNPAILGTAQ
jgi:hypothetical protein